MTGIKAVDAFHPLGHGQCLALLGRRSAGKSSLVLHVIANQRGLQGDDRVHCVYVAIGQVRLPQPPSRRERKGLGMRSSGCLVVLGSSMCSLSLGLVGHCLLWQEEKAIKRTVAKLQKGGTTPSSLPLWVYRL